LRARPIPCRTAIAIVLRKIGSTPYRAEPGREARPTCARAGQRLSRAGVNDAQVRWFQEQTHLIGRAVGRRCAWVSAQVRPLRPLSRPPRPTLPHRGDGLGSHGFRGP
jgi:hypothetical protein